MVLATPGTREVQYLKTAAARFTEMAARYNMNIDPLVQGGTAVRRAAAAPVYPEALYRNVELLILDEPTAVLTPRKSRALSQCDPPADPEGKTVIFISHKLNEIMTICDRAHRAVASAPRPGLPASPIAQITEEQQLAA